MGANKLGNIVTYYRLLPAVVFNSTGVFRGQLCRPIDETLARREEGHDPGLLNLQSLVPKIPTTLERPVVVAADPLSDAIDIDIDSAIYVFTPRRHVGNIVQETGVNTSGITLEPVDRALDVKPLFVHHKLDRVVQL